MKLQTWGWVSWDEACEIVGEAQGLWLAPSQVCCGPLPRHAPDTDRIHAWNDTALWRLRVDADRVLVTALTDGALPGAKVREVTVTTADLRVWDEGYVGGLNCPPTWKAHDVPGVSQLRFLRPA